MLNIEEIEKIIGSKVEDWKGNCYGISCSLVEHGIIKGKAVFGKYYGQVSPNSMFHGKPHQQHGWIRTADGKIFDPTRWVFESVEPYIYESTTDNKDYDEGANILRELFKRPAPSFNPEARSIEVDNKEINLILNVLLQEKKQSNIVTMEQIAWCASLSINQLNDFAFPFFSWLDSKKLSVLAPIDNFKLVLNK